MLAEIRSFENILLTLKADSQPIFKEPNRAVHVLLKKSGDKRWLIVANDSRRPEKASFVLDGAKSIKRIDTGPGEQATLQLENGVAALQLKAHGAAVFELTP